MIKKILRNSLDYLRWKSIFDLLSMDLIDLEIVKAMGLIIEAKELGELRKAARGFFGYYWPDRSHENLTDQEYEEDRENFMQKLFFEISGSLGVEKAERFYQWGIDCFPLDGAERSLEWRWSVLLRRLAGYGAFEPIPTPENIPKNKIKAVIRLIYEYIDKNEHVTEVSEALIEEPRTEWDERVFQSYEFDDDILISAELQMKFYNFQIMWKQIEELLTKEEIEALHQWGIKNDDIPGPF
jgi:hypothetical protein